MKLRQLIVTATAPFALFSVSPLLAQSAVENPAPQAEENAKTQARPALWKVSDEDTTIYLFGTLHFLPDNIEWYTPAIDQALASSSVIVKELGPESEDPMAAQQALIAHGLLPADQSLSGLLTAEQKAALDARLLELTPQLTQMGVPVPLIDRFKPWLAFLNLTIAKFSQIGFDPELGVESVLKEKAQGKEWIGLETLDFQFGLFASLSDEDQIALLTQTVEGLDEVENMLPAMAENWAAGQSEELAGLLNDDMEESGLLDLLLYQRNANWAEWIDERLESTPGTVFIAVGAGHLGGENSVQDYLAQRDIKITRVQ